MAHKNFWDLLHEKQLSLTKSGIIIAEYLIQHPEEAQFLSISSLARNCNMAEATIYRFCKQLGFEGYNEMKIALAQANAASISASVSYDLDFSTDTAALCENINLSFQSAIASTLSLLSPEAVDQAALLLQRARNVYCMGQGGSLILAHDIWARLSTISNKFHTCGDNHLQVLTASLTSSEDVILFASYSGATRDMMDTLSIARKTGAKIILITHYADAPGTALADVVLLCGALEAPLDGGSIPIKVAELFVAEALILRYSLDNHELVNISRIKTSAAVATKLL